MIDDFISKVKKISNDPESQKLISLLELWKENDRTVLSLENDVERYLGNSWISSEDEYRRIYSEWSKFRDNEIRSIAGMTMNERLFVFGIFDRFDNASSEQQKMAIYAKLHAKP